MTGKLCRILVFGLLLAAAVVVAAGCGEIPGVPPAGQASPPAEGTIDYARYQALKAQVEALRKEGRDVSGLDTIIADIEHWIATGKVAEANLRITDLEGALADFAQTVIPTYPPEPPLPPAPSYAPAPESGGTVLFTEDFSAANALSSWQSAFLSVDPGNMATWQQRQNALYLNEGAGGMQIVGMIDVTGQGWKDYVYNVDIYPRGNLEVGAIVRYENGSFYRFRYLNWEHSTKTPLLLERVVGDEVTILAQAEGAGYQPEQWYHVEFAAVGSQLTVYLNGQKVLQAQDDALPQGQVGVYALTVGSVYFDNVRVVSAR